MKNTLSLVFLAVLFLTGCGPSSGEKKPDGSPEKTDSFILDDLLQYESHEELAAAFGKDAVEGSMPGPEGTSFPASILYPESDKEVYFTFKDKTVEESPPTMVNITGERSPWKTATGVKLGDSVKEVEKINGKPYLISGFGWDYGGNVTNWNGGKMEGYLISFLESAENIQLDENDQGKVYGDGTFISSSEPLLERLKPVVMGIYIIADE